MAQSTILVWLFKKKGILKKAQVYINNTNLEKLSPPNSKWEIVHILGIGGKRNFSPSS